VNLSVRHDEIFAARYFGAKGRDLEKQDSKDNCCTSLAVKTSTSHEGKPPKIRSKRGKGTRGAAGKENLSRWRKVHVKKPLTKGGA